MTILIRTLHMELINGDTHLFNSFKRQKSFCHWVNKLSSIRPKDRRKIVDTVMKIFRISGGSQKDRYKPEIINYFSQLNLNI